MAQDSSIINIIDESGFQSNSNSIAFLGTKTNAKDHYQFRFSQDLPPKSLFRTSLIPNKRKITIPQKVIQKNAKELENSHMNTSLLPNTSTKTNNPKIKLRSPYMSQGHNLRQTFPGNSTYGSVKRSQSSIDPNPFHKLRFSTTKKEEKNKKLQPAIKPIDKESKLASTQSALETIYYPLQSTSKKNTNRRLLLNLPEKEPQQSKPSKAEDSNYQIESNKRFNSIEIQNMAPHIQRNKKADNSDTKTSEQSQDHLNESKEAEKETKEQLTAMNQQGETSNENEEVPKVEQSLNENEEDSKVEQSLNENEEDSKVEQSLNENEVNPKGEQSLNENEVNPKVEQSLNENEVNPKVEQSLNEHEEVPKVEQSLNENEVNQTNEKDQKTEETFKEESKTENLTEQEAT